MTNTEKAKQRLDQATSSLEAAQRRAERAKAAFEAARDKKSLSDATEEQLDAELDLTLAEREVSDATAHFENERRAELTSQFEAMLPQCDVAVIAEPYVAQLVKLYADLATIHDEAMEALRKIAPAHRAAGALLGRGARGSLPELKIGRPRDYFAKALRARVDVDERVELLPHLGDLELVSGLDPFTRKGQLRQAAE